MSKNSIPTDEQLAELQRIFDEEGEAFQKDSRPLLESLQWFMKRVEVRLRDWGHRCQVDQATVDTFWNEYRDDVGNRLRRMEHMHN